MICISLSLFSFMPTAEVRFCVKRNWWAKVALTDLACSPPNGGLKANRLIQTSWCVLAAVTFHGPITSPRCADYLE